MISIIICSRDPEALRGLSKNIDQTIGSSYEIIPIDNATGKFGICEAYNIGANMSKYPYLCFIHEDILFHTKSWGNIIISLFEDKSIGLIGVAGATYKAATISAWWDTDIQNRRVNIIHPVDNLGQQYISLNSGNSTIADVVMVDGVFLGTRKEVWQKFKFDQKLLTGFHFYDADFSTSIFTKYRVIVTYDILIEHFSKGSPDSLSWLDSAFLYHKKWRNALPLCANKFRIYKKVAFEKVACYNIINRCRMLSFSISALSKNILLYSKFPYSLLFVVFYIYFSLKRGLKFRKKQQKNGK